MYVSRRLRVFDDPVLAPLVLSNRLSVSTAEELLREPNADARRELAEQAVNERWERPQVRAALAKRNAALQHQSSPQLAGRIRALYEELVRTDPTLVSTRARRELFRLLEAARTVTSSQTNSPRSLSQRRSGSEYAASRPPRDSSSNNS